MRFLKSASAHILLWAGLAGLWAAFAGKYEPADQFFFKDLGFLSWGSALQLGSNTFFSWRDDIFGLALKPFLNSIDPAQTSSFLGLIRAAIFSSLLFGLSNSGRIRAFLIALFLPAVLAVLFGFNSPYMQALVFSPILLLALRLLGGKNPDLAASGLFFASLLVAASGNQLGLPIVICAVFASNDWHGLSRNDKFAAALLALMPPLAMAAWAPPPPFPGYPWDGHVVPSSGASFAIYPALGSQAPIAIINRLFEKSFYLLAGLPLALLAAIEIWKSKKIAAGAAVALFLALSIILDCALPEDFSQIMPLQVISRVLPGAYFTPILGAALVSALFSLMTSESPRTSLWLGFPLMIAAVLGPIFFPASTEYIETSPSNYILSKEGASMKDRVKLTQDAELKNPAELHADISASSDQPEAPVRAAADDDYGTRWSTMTASQAGGEWVRIKFSRPEPIDVIDLSPGNFETDFPRGLRIDCAGESGDNAQFKNIYQADSWQGGLALTKDDFPYYLPQKRVRVILPRTEQCLLLQIEQTGASSDFDWSIAEIKIGAISGETKPSR